MAKTLAAMTQDNWAYGGTAGYARYEFSDNFVDEDGRQFEGGSKSYLEVATTISGNVVTVPAFPNFPTTESAVHNNGVTVTCHLLDSNRVKRTTLFENVRIYTSLPSTVTLSQLVLANGASRIQRDTDVWTKEQVIDYVNTFLAGGSPTTATYITQTPNAVLANEQAMSLLGTGLVKNTTGTGVQSIAVADTDYQVPLTFGGGVVRTVNAVALDTTHVRNVDHTAVSITAGAGLTGGGDISASRTLDVGAGAGITVNANDVALTTPGTNSVSSVNSSTGNHTHAITTSSNPGAVASILATDASGHLSLVRLNTDTIADRSGGNLTISPAGDIVLDPTGNDVLPNLNYDINMGSLSKKFLTGHFAELWSETLVAQNTIATIGGRILIGPTTPLIADVGTGDSTIDVRYNNLASGDHVYLEADSKVEFMVVTSSATTITGGFRYSVTRNLDGSGANQWYAGDAVFKTGQTGAGFIDIYSVRGVKAASEAGPTIVGNVRNSATYNDWSPRWAIGNLNGLYGYGTNEYGVGMGVPSAAHILIDPTNGIRIRHNTTNKIVLDAAGSASFTGSITAASGTIATWTINATSLSSGTTYIASGFNIPAGQVAWFGRTASGAQGYFFRDAGGRVMESWASSGTIYPYLGVYDGTNYRVVVGGLNNAFGSDGSTNSVGMKIWDSAGAKLVEFSDVQNIISGFSVGADYFRDAANSFGLASTVTGGDDVRFWAGATFANRATAPFRLTEAGALVATSATITGAITATSGAIGGFDVGADYIRDTGNSFGLASTVTGGDDVRFWAGAAFASRTTAPFRLTEAGALTATNATLAGSLTAGSGAVVLNTSGLTIHGSSGKVTAQTLKFDVGFTRASIYSTAASEVSDGGNLMLEAEPGVPGSTSDIQVISTGAAGGSVTLQAADSGAGDSVLTLNHASSSGTLKLYGSTFAGFTVGANAAPNAMLDVRGTIRGSSTLTLDLMTTGSVLFAGASGVVSQDNANLFWDDTNNRLGIGTVTPTAKLHVATSDSSTAWGADAAIVSIGSNTNTTANNWAIYGFSTADTSGSTRGAAYISAQFTARTATTVTADLVFHLSDAGSYNERMRITADGGVIVGSPTGGSKGVGTINVAGDIYKNNTAYSNPHGGFEYAYTGKVERFADRMAAMGLLNYKPLSLDELEQYTRDNFHFPYFSDEDNNGIFSGGERHLLITEELAVHLFNLHKRVKRLEAR